MRILAAHLNLHINSLEINVYSPAHVNVPNYNIKMVVRVVTIEECITEMINFYTFSSNCNLQKNEKYANLYNKNNLGCISFNLELFRSSKLKQKILRSGNFPFY